MARQWDPESPAEAERHEAWGEIILAGGLVALVVLFLAAVALGVR